MLFILLILLKSSFFKLHHLATASCQRQGSEKGKYDCTVESASDVNSYTCDVPNHSCQARRTRYTAKTTGDSTSKGSLEFMVTLTMNGYTDADVQVTVKDSSGIFISTNIADPISLQYHFGNDEKPRIVCHTPIAIDDPYTTKSTCNAYLKIDTDSITTANDNQCTIALSDPISYPNGFLIQKVYTVTITDSEKKCNKGCNPTLLLPDSYQRVTQSTSLNHVSRCQEPVIHIIGHDKFERSITCVLEISYEFVKVDLETSTTGVTLVTPTFTKATIENANYKFSFTYTISDFSKTNFEILINFKVYQESNTLTHTISKTITYQHKLEEQPKIECEEKQNELKTLKNIYKCNFISKTQPITIQTDTNGYAITPNTAQNLDAQNSIFKKEIDVSVTATSVVCNKKQLVKLHFGQASTVFFFVSHTTSCRDPTIGCATHNSIERTITCQFKVEFTFIRMVLISQNSFIKLNPTEMKPADLNSAAITQKEIKYTLTDLRMASNKKFNILFKVIQSHHHLAYEKTLGFEYVLKKDEHSHLTCNPTNKLQSDHWSAVRLVCSSVSSLWNITLKVNSNDFEIIPKSVTGENVHNVYENKNFNVVIKPKSIKCKDTKTVTISFEEGIQSHDYIYNHITNCPNPIIACHRHDIVERKIFCNFESSYEFDKIKLAVSIGSVVIKGSKDITYAQIIRDKELKIEYGVSALTSQDHEFIIDFTIDQTGNTDVYTEKHSFIYTLSQNEIPGILCHEDLTNPPPALGSVKYKCTMVFKSDQVSLSTDSTKYTIHPTSRSGTVRNGIANEHEVSVTITLTSIVCDRLERINIKMTDNTQNYEFSHSRKTICPEPIIYCHTHDEVNRELTCKVKVDFPFSNIVLSTSHSSVQLTTTPISPTTDSKINDDNKKIAYSITKYKNKKHEFDIKFTVQQTENQKAFEKILHFTYILTRQETPHISCSLNSPQVNQEFHVKKYSCKIISRQKQILLSIDQQDRYIYIYILKPSGSITLDEYDEIYKKDIHEITIEPKEIICGRKSEIKVTFKDEDNVHYSDIVSHSTICPEPEIKDFENTQGSRSASWVVETKYELVKLAVSSNMDKIEIESTIEPIKSKDNVWKSKVTVTFKPLDWSYNEHKFKIINTITPKDASPVSITTSEITLQLIAEELPKISCTIHQSEIPLEFNEKSYACNILSKKSTVLLSLTDAKYSIVDSLGVADFENNVYKWKDYKIVIRDMEIKCSKETSFKVSLSEYTTNPETQIKYRTTCPQPDVTCDHSTESRTIICNVASQYPYSDVEIKSSTNIQMSQIEKSTIVRSNTKWQSTHTIPYELKSFLNSETRFSLQLDFVQDNSVIHHSSHSFSYVIRKNEKPQISCQSKENVTNLAFGTTIYVCYIVKKNNEIKIEADPSYYEITMKKPNVIAFLDLYKWQSLEVQVNDSRIDCNRTMKINLKMKDGDDELKSAIEHTTHCKEISGECMVSDNGGAYIHCNYRSEMSFELKEFAFSDQINCSRSEDISKNVDDGQHYIFEINPLTSKETFEFVFNVTLSYSEYSDVTFSYVLEFHEETSLLPSSSSEKSVSAAATGTIPVYSLFIVVIITGTVMTLVFMKKSTKIDQ